MSPTKEARPPRSGRYAELSMQVLEQAYSQDDKPLVKQRLGSAVPLNTHCYGLDKLGLRNLGQVYHNLSVPELIEHALLRGEGVL